VVFVEEAHDAKISDVIMKQVIIIHIVPFFIETSFYLAKIDFLNSQDALVNVFIRDFTYQL
jgi:hypothetical protein